MWILLEFDSCHHPIDLLLWVHFCYAYLMRLDGPLGWSALLSTMRSIAGDNTTPRPFQAALPLQPAGHIVCLPTASSISSCNGWPILRLSFVSTSCFDGRWKSHLLHATVKFMHLRSDVQCAHWVNEWHWCLFEFATPFSHILLFLSNSYSLGYLVIIH